MRSSELASTHLASNSFHVHADLRTAAGSARCVWLHGAVGAKYCFHVLQAAYAAYSAIATQAATVVGAMDKVWSGTEAYNGSNHGAADAQSGTANAQQQQARLAVALQNSEDGEDVYVQV